MTLLCIEDVQDKYEHIKKVLDDIGVKVVLKTNYQDGIVELSRNKYPYLLLDMSMPICGDTSRKDNFDVFAGMMILREIKRKKYKIKVIIITGFDDFEHGNEIMTLDELVSTIRRKYAAFFAGVLKYDSASVEWQENLKNYLSEV